MNTTLEQQWQRVATRHGAHLKPPKQIDRGLVSSQDANIAKFCYIDKQPIANRTQYADKVPKTTLNELLAANLGRIKDARDLTLPYIAKCAAMLALWAIAAGVETGTRLVAPQLAQAWCRVVRRHSE